MNWIEFLIFLGLSSCVRMNPIESNSQTLIPSEHIPTVIELTVQALVSQNVIETPEPVVTLPERTPTSTLVPSSTETPTPTITITATGSPTSMFNGAVTSLPAVEIPYASIQFLNPGALSQVISPIELHAFLIPGDDARARVELFGEDGRLMSRQLFVFSSPPGVQTNLRTDIPFEIEEIAETATLVISVDDSYGRRKELASLELILISLGDSDINPSDDHLAPIMIQEPGSKVLVQGDELLVSGLVRINSDQHLLVELITVDGKVIGSRLAGIAPGAAGDHKLFAVKVPFIVESPTWVRVTISERNKWGTGATQLTSIEVLLSP